MLLASAGVSGTGALSSADEFVEESTGGSGPGVKPGASNGECLSAGMGECLPGPGYAVGALGATSF